MKNAFALVVLAALLGGCAGFDAPRAEQYRCERNFDFAVRFVDDSALLDSGPRGRDTLLRDAGGQGPNQSVFRSDRVKAEFGLGASGREAVVHYYTLPLVVKCVRE